MKLKPFKYVPAGSLEEVQGLLREQGERAAVMAGGTDLMGTLKDAIHETQPDYVISLKPVEGYTYVTEEPDGVRIGALTTLAEIVNNPVIQQKYPLLAEAARTVASPQIRNVATIAGNLCQEPRCWYYRNPENTFDCMRKGGKRCDALFGENRFHSIYGGMRVSASACTSACPIHNEIPSYMAKIRAGETDAALSILMETNPLPAITGRVCAHACEWNCNRLGYDDAVATREIERYLGDYALDNSKEVYSPPKTESGKKVAVVGSGPSGLSAAYFLRKAGHEVTIYDRMSEAGGMLRYAIPAYRLPKDIVKVQIEALEGMGIRFELGKAIGSLGLTLADLKSKYDSVFLATGLWKGKTLRLDREELLESGLDFLLDLQQGVERRVGERVLVIGGGSVAVDVAISAKRLGAGKVMMACLESPDIMPAIPEDIEQAHEEGIEIFCSCGPHKILEQDGKVAGMEFVRCTSVFDEEGRFAPQFDESQKTVVEADQILVAIGQGSDLSYAGPELRAERGFIITDERSGETSMPGVFAGGDVIGGPATAVQAMATGKRAAEAIDAYLNGLSEPATGSVRHERLSLNGEAFAAHGRVQAPRLPVSERTIRGEDAQTLSREAASQESGRCVNCGCVAVSASDLAPALIALGATIRTTQRTLAAEELFTAAESKTTVLECGELIEEIEIPSLSSAGIQKYLKFRIRNSLDFPIVAAAFRAEMTDGKYHDARVVLGAVAPVPLRMREVEQLLEGREPSDGLAREVALAATTDAQPLSCNRYKVEVVKGLLAKLCTPGVLS